VRKNGVPVEYVLFPDEGHGFQKKENEDQGLHPDDPVPRHAPEGNGEACAPRAARALS
jgi:hypothetical protein